MATFSKAPAQEEPNESAVPPDAASLEVPPLPLPDIDQTLDRYLDALKAVIPEPELEQTREMVQEFRSDVDLKQRVDAALIDRSKQMENWVR